MQKDNIYVLMDFFENKENIVICFRGTSFLIQKKL